jgi:hypothetical protein
VQGTAGLGADTHRLVTAVQEASGALPQFVKDEFDAFLECGILAHGFLRSRCADLQRPILGLGMPFSLDPATPRLLGGQFARSERVVC